MKRLLKVFAAAWFGCASTVRAEPPDMLLSALLKTIDTLSASLTNAAENFAAVNGSVVISAQGSADDLVATIPAPAFKSRSQISDTLLSREVGLAPRGVPLVQLGDLATTAIGALQSGALLGSTGTTGTFDSSGLVQNFSQHISSGTTVTTSALQSNGSSTQTIVLQNIALNQGQIDGRMSLVLAEADARVARLTTTAIGAMESGQLSAQIAGNLSHQLMGN